MKHSALFYLSVFTFIVTIGLLASIWYWLFWPVKVLDVKNPTAITVDKTVYKAGDRISYTISYCKNNAITGEVNRALVNSIRIPFTGIRSNLATGCKTITNRDLVIPAFVDSGTYHIETTAEYKINPLRTQTEFWRSVDLQVVNN